MYVYICVQIPLGVILKSEVKLEEMVDVVADLQQYVPVVTTDVEYNIPGREKPVSAKLDNFHYILFGQLSPCVHMCVHSI